MVFTDLLKKYEHKQVVINGITADKVRDKKTNEYKGGTTLEAIYTDYVVLKVHNVTAGSKDELTEKIETIAIPITAITSLSEGQKDVAAETIQKLVV